MRIAFGLSASGRIGIGARGSSPDDGRPGHFDHVFGGHGFPPGLQLFDDLLRQRDSEIGTDEGFFEFIPIHRTARELLEDGFEEADGHG